MECSCIPYTRVPKSSQLLLDYLYHFDRVAPFYSGGSPFDLASYKRVAGDLPVSPKSRPELAEILVRQNQAFGSGEAALANIRLLAQPGTVAVVTGQQVGLVSGPTFTLYKALTAVRLAQWLSGQGLTAVPVFWLATDDHDLEEVALAQTLDEEYNLVRLQDAGQRPAPRSSVGYVKLSLQITGALDALEAALGPGPPRDRLLQDLRSSYAPGATWGEAFGRFMARLFSRWGVVLLDALDPDIHRLSAPVYERALSRAEVLRTRLGERSQALVRAGYHAQVHVGEDSTLLFAARQGNRVSLHLSEEPAGKEGFFLGGSDGPEKPEKREKPGQAGQHGTPDKMKMALAELKAWVNKQPLDFSPNALLRPVVQDSLLPTVAYVAGASELAYLGQSQVVYAELGRPMPVIFPRAGFTLVDRRVQRTLEKYSLSVEDVWKGEEHLNLKLAAAASASSGWSEHFAQSERELAGLLGRLRDDIQAIDPTLLDLAKHTEEKINYQLERLKAKLSRAALGRSDVLARHQQSLLRFLTPAKDLQEREVSGAYFLGRAGYELLDRLLAQIQTLSSDHQVVVY